MMVRGEVYTQSGDYFVVTRIQFVPPAGTKAFGLPLAEYVKLYPEKTSKALESESKGEARKTIYLDESALPV